MIFKSTLPSGQRDLGSNADDSTTRSTMLNQKSADLNYNTVRSTDSFSSSQQNQLEFIQDNIDYQWFIDYGYRDGGSSLQRSSILSASCYDDLARDLDANLAHVDMEDFSHEDIHSLLHTLPPMCVRDMQEREGEMFASMVSTGDGDEEEGEESHPSLVKSGPLFSPVKECSLPPAGTYSVDSLDCDEMMITCQHPNKHNYTIAFQGSTMMSSETCNESSEDSSKCSQGTGAGSIEKPKPKWMTELRGVGAPGAGTEMTNSDSPLTTWSKIRRDPLEDTPGGLSRAPSGNNNSAPIGAQFDNCPQDFKPLQSACSVPSLLQSQSLPNLVSNKHQQWLLRNKLLALNSSINAAEKAFDVPIKIFDIEQSSPVAGAGGASLSSSALSSTSRHSVATSSPPPSLSSSNNQNTPPHTKKHTTTPSHQANFSLLKLFIKQKNTFDSQVTGCYNKHDNNANTTTDTTYMSWNECDTSAPNVGGQDRNLNNNNNNNVTGWNNAKRAGIAVDKIPTNGGNLNKAKMAVAHAQYMNENNNNNYSFDSLTTQNGGGMTLENKMAATETEEDGEEHLSVSQNQSGGPGDSYYCDCGGGADLPSQDMTESCDSFSSHTNRPTVRSQDTLNKEDKQRGASTQQHRAQCPMFDKSMQTSARPMSASSSKAQTRESGCSGGGGKAVYVLYPNYTLPDLSFLRDHATEIDLNNVFLWPQKFEPSPVCEQAPAPPFQQEPGSAPRGRPMSCVDLDTLKRRGFSHVRDWSSLIYLLPREYTRILSDAVPEIADHVRSDSSLTEDVPLPLFCTKNKRSASCGESTSSSNAPSSGYRGSSSILNDEGSAGSNPLFIYRYDSISSADSSMLQQQAPSHRGPPPDEAPPRPPLPRSILRQQENIAKLKHGAKRFSMFEFGSKENLDNYEASSQTTTTTTHQQQVNKRASLPSNFVNKGKEEGCWEDEGVEVGGTDTTASSEHPEDPASRLEHLLEESGGPDSWHKEDITTLRAQVIKFLNVTNKDSTQQQRKAVSFTTPPNSPNSTAPSSVKQLYQCKLQSGAISGVPIKEERESSPESKSERARPSVESIQKNLIESVINATRHLVNNFSSEHLNLTSKVTLNTLCPALYALLTEGLKPALTTSFGDTPNSVWQVIEGSAQLGPSTKSLHELVLRLNSEDIVLSEGLLKFNAFVFGLLNVRGLDTWLSYLRTRESLLRRHYADSSLFVTAARGNATSKTLLDLLIGAMKPLTSLSFHLDLLYECRTLHESLVALSKLPLSPVSNSISQGSSLRTSWTLRKLIRSIQSQSSDDEQEVTLGGPCRPRSCIDAANCQSSDVASSVKKRWSTICAGSKLALAFQSLGGQEEEYPDSLEPVDSRLAAVARLSGDDNTSSDLSDMPDLSYTGSSNQGCTGSSNQGSVGSVGSNQGSTTTASNSRCGGGKFKRLQQRWEMLSNTPLGTPASSPMKARSRIPRPVSSPTPPPKPSGLPLPKPVARKPPLPSPTGKTPTGGPLGLRKPSSELITLPSKMLLPGAAAPTGVRQSRVDTVNAKPLATRPSSLPYKKTSVGGLERRAVSSSMSGRQTAPASGTPVKYVKTLSHRLPSDNGHLSYNSGERLKVVLEVDDTWLLCCRGRQKGLVPRSAVILY
uniref:Iporin n=1 Tax=Cacopsylla melanoneura TaxID=428564 RepID=A0A8D8R5G1_9HEMI